MNRPFTPEGDYRWDSPGPLPRTGQLFLDMAKAIQDKPVPGELSLLPAGIDRHGVIEGAEIKPHDPRIHLLGFVALKRLASPEYSLNAPDDNMTYVTRNAVIVSQVAGSAGLAIASGSEVFRPQDFEEMRTYYAAIHQKLDQDYISRLNQKRERARKIKFVFERIEDEILGTKRS